MVLDVGCGAQPYRHLLSPQATYNAIDYSGAESHFGYSMPDTTYYEGDHWPIADASIDVILCTETLEHVPEPSVFLGEAFRVLKAGGCLILTVPFAARWHYIPHDYWRFTPSGLNRLLAAAGFEHIAVYARGNALTVACYKVMALLLPLLMPQQKSLLKRLPLPGLRSLDSPILIALAAIGTSHLKGKGGDDCLGYTAVGYKTIDRRHLDRPLVFEIKHGHDHFGPPGLPDLWHPTASSHVFAEANVDVDALDHFAFASRKLPEYMHWRLAECRKCDLLYATRRPPWKNSHAFTRTPTSRAVRRPGMRAVHTAGCSVGSCESLPDRRGLRTSAQGTELSCMSCWPSGLARCPASSPQPPRSRPPTWRFARLIHHDIFRPDLFPAGSLSLITCFQTIEHLADPLAFCRDALRALKPGGALFLIGHNRRAISAKLLGRKSPIFDIEHMQLFSPSSVRNLLKAAGFANVDVRTIYNQYPVRYWVQLFPFPKTMKLSCSASLNSNVTRAFGHSVAGRQSCRGRLYVVDFQSFIY